MTASISNDYANCDQKLFSFGEFVLFNPEAQSLSQSLWHVRTGWFREKV